MKISDDYRRLETDRLILKKISYRYVFRIKKEFDYALTRYMFPAPAKTMREEFRVVRSMRRDFKCKTEFVYAITKKGSGEFLGMAGLHGLNKKTPEFGIWVKRGAHGNRYGREAVYGLRELAKILGYTEAVYPVDERNAASIKIPQSMGGTVQSRKSIRSQTDRDLEVVVFRVKI